MLPKHARHAISAVAKSHGVPSDLIAAGIGAMDRSSTGPREMTALAVRQARVCEMLDCSRHHVRKLERLGLLAPVDVGGLKRYPVAKVMQLLEGAGGPLGPVS